MPQLLWLTSPQEAAAIGIERHGGGDDVWVESNSLRRDCVEGVLVLGGVALGVARQGRREDGDKGGRGGGSLPCHRCGRGGRVPPGIPVPNGGGRPPGGVGFQWFA